MRTCQWRSLNASPSIGVFPLARFAAIWPSFRGISDEFCDVAVHGAHEFSWGHGAVHDALEPVGDDGEEIGSAHLDAVVANKGNIPPCLI
jgi:hypothetical protein